MNIIKPLNQYIVIKEQVKIPTKTKAGIFLTTPESIDPNQKGEVLMLPDDLPEGHGLKKGTKVLFYPGSGTEIGENLLVHIDNIIGIIPKYDI